MKLLFVFFSLFICMISEEVEEEDFDLTTEEPFPGPDFAQILSKSNGLDLEITKVLGSLSPDKSEGEKLISDLQEYVINLGPLIHNMAAEENEVLMVAKSVYRQGAPKFLAIPVNSELLQQSFQWDDIQMKVFQHVYDNAGKNWRNFLNMCERHRIES